MVTSSMSNNSADDYLTLQLPRSNCSFSLLAATYFLISYRNLVLDQDNNYLIHLNILITCMLDSS